MPPQEATPYFDHLSGLLEFEEESPPKDHSADNAFLSAAADTSTVEKEETTPERRRSSTVRFSVVKIREFDRIIGDHPDTKSGLSLAIGWDYSERSAVSVDSYEDDRQEPRRSKTDLILTPRMKRKVMKKGFGVSKDDIEKAERKVALTQKRKERRTKLHPFVVRTEDALRSATRRVRRLSLEKQRSV